MRTSWHRSSTLVVCWLCRVWNSLHANFFPGQTLCAALVPHKRQFVGSKWIYQCGSLREALVCLPEDHKDDLNHATVYAYLGGGVPHQPPHTYGIVVRNLPIHVADHLCALVHSHVFAEADLHMFVPKGIGMEAAERIRRVSERKAVVSRLAQRISQRFASEGFPWPDLSGEDQITWPEDTCIVCEGTGRVVLCDGRVMFDECPLLCVGGHFFICWLPQAFRTSCARFFRCAPLCTPLKYRLRCQCIPTKS